MGIIEYIDTVIFLLQSIKKQQCPKELEPADRRSSVHVNLTRRDENYPVSSFILSSSVK